MFDEEEPIKKPKPLDLDDLSVEEIEGMINDHKSEIINLEALLKLSLIHISEPTRPY